MPIVPLDLASAIQDSLGFSGTPSSELIGDATAIQMELMAATVTFAPGSINGNAPSSGGPLIMGMGMGGKIIGMTGPHLAGNMQKLMKKPTITKGLNLMAAAIATHLSTGLVSFTAGSIVAACSNSPLSPGAVTGLACVNGKISGLSGPAMAALMASAFDGPPSSPMKKMCDAICKYIMKNATCSIAPGGVTGACSAGGGPIAAGTAVGGKIS